MYPLHTSSLPSTSTFKPISPQQVTATNTNSQNTESSPQSLLPCGQRTPTNSTNTSDTPSQNTPPQPFVHSQQQPRTPTQMHHTPPKPYKPQDIQHSPVKTNINPPTQPSIPDKEPQRVPKLTNGSQVKRSKPQPRQQDERLCFYCNQLGHLKRNCPEFPYCPKCRTRGHHQINAPANHSETDIHVKLESPGINGGGTKIFHNFLIIITDVSTVQEIIKPEIVQQHGNSKPQPLTILLVVQVLPHTVTHLTHHITNLHNLIHSHQPAINTVNPLYTFKHQPSTLTLHIFNPTYNSLPYHLHKITKTLTIIQVNNKCTHH